MNADLIDKLNLLTTVERALVVQLIETLAEERRQQDRNALDAAITAARGSWPKRMTVHEIDAEVEAMRDEWNGRS